MGNRSTTLTGQASSSHSQPRPVCVRLWVQAQPAPSQPWVAEAVCVPERMMCLFRETKCRTMNPIRFHRHMKMQSILHPLGESPATGEYFILCQQLGQTSEWQPAPP